MPAATELQRQQRKDFGARVRELRQQLGISQEQLAHRAELDRSYVGHVERGERNVSLDNIHRLAAALDAPAAQLLERG